MSQSDSSQREMGAVGSDKPVILIIDDDPPSWHPLYREFAPYGQPRTVTTMEEAIAVAPYASFIFLDMLWGDQELGLEILKKLQPLARNGTPIYILTHQPASAACDEALSSGASGVLKKPEIGSEVDEMMRKVFSEVLSVLKRQTRNQSDRLKESIAREYPGDTESIRQFRSKLFTILTELNCSVSVTKDKRLVFLEGEMGAGKTYLAEFLGHEGPFRAAYKKVPVGNFPAAQLEVEIFGAEKGAYPGCVQRRPGLAEQACGGTLFLDEVQEWDSTIQAKLKTFIEDGMYKPIGGKYQRFHGLIVIATNQHLAQLFKPDFLSRLAGARSLTLPPLRDRKEDIKPFGKRLLETLSNEDNLPTCELEDAAWSALEANPLPGNYRDLKAILEHAHGLARREATLVITSYHIGTAQTEAQHVYRDGTPHALQLTKGESKYSQVEGAEGVPQTMGAGVTDDHLLEIVREALKACYGNLAAKSIPKTASGIHEDHWWKSFLESIDTTVCRRLVDTPLSPEKVGPLLGTTGRAVRERLKT